MAYDSNGNKISLNAVTEKDIASHIPGADNRYITYSLRFIRNDSNQQIDGYGNTVYYENNESFEIVEHLGNIATSPTKPVMTSDDVVLCDLFVNSAGINSVDFSRRIELSDVILSLVKMKDGHSSGLDSDKLDGAEKSTDINLSGNSDNNIPTEKAVKTYTDSGLAGKSNNGHVHDDRYYTEAQVDSALSGKSNNGHVHDDRYYTESEIDSALSGQVGIGQSWQNMAGERISSVEYTNLSGKPIFVFVSVICGANVYANIHVDSIIIGTMGSAGGFTEPRSTVMFIVPDGSTYSIGNYGGITITYWWEFR